MLCGDFTLHRTQEFGPQLCLVTVGLQFAVGTACRSDWLLGGLEQARVIVLISPIWHSACSFAVWTLQRVSVPALSPLLLSPPCLEDLFPV